MTKTLESWSIPAVPLSPNATRYRHWRVAHAEAQRWRKLVLILPQGPWFAGSRDVNRWQRVKLWIQQFRQRELDPDNLHGSVKPLLDALVRRGWAVDDSAKWLEYAVIQTWGVSAKSEFTRVEWRRIADGVEGSEADGKGLERVQMEETTKTSRVVTREQALAFVGLLLSGKPAVHLEAILGAGKVATVDDFTVATPVGVERSDDLVCFLDHYLLALQALVEHNRRRVAEMALEVEEAESARIELERKNSIPGTVPEDLEKLPGNGRGEVTTDADEKSAERAASRSTKRPAAVGGKGKRPRR